MIYGFATNDGAAAVGALLVYGVYRSRDTRRFKVNPEMWGRIERAVKSAAKRSADLPEFIERLKPKVQCSNIKPRFMTTGELETVTLAKNPETGELVGPGQENRREFWVNIIDRADAEAVTKALYGKTSYVIALVRDRLEREKPLEPLANKEGEDASDE